MGTGDDNVHMENTVQFMQKLIEAGIPYDLQIYPRKTHSISGPDVRTHLYNRILAQFEQYLKPPVVSWYPCSESGAAHVWQLLDWVANNTPTLLTSCA